jgi:DNA-binding response OmpR family regulator
VSIKVLIIDDAVHIRRLIARMLEQANFVTLEASNGLQGLQVLREQKPDVVTCDIAMPLMDGYEFLLAAKEDPETQNIPVIVITAVGQDDETVKATEMGADAYLTKPFSSTHLLEIIQTQLKRSSP